MDMRDKLLPIFIKEAAKNISLLQSFLRDSAFSLGDPNEIEAAFRAAHTLKGTARLVQVDSVHQLGQRIEVLLERHLTAQTRLTVVECEALELAIGWLNHLLVDLQNGRTGSSVLIADTLTALELATRFPGNTPLAELLDSAVQLRVPHLNDPFAGDPELLLVDDDILRLANDPFADDPSLGFGFNILPDPLDLLSQSKQRALSAAGDAFVDALPDPASAASITFPFDPFAEDKSFLDSEEVSPPAAAETVSNAQQPSGVLVTTAPAALPDPFAEDSVFDASDVLELSATAVAPVAAKAANRLEEIADWMLLPTKDVGPQRLYVCCCFALSGQNYYFPIEQVQEIAELPPLLPLALAPPLVSGLINLRGQVMPVIDLSALTQAPQPATTVRRLVVVEQQREKLAFLTDGIPYLAEEFNGKRIDLAEFINSHKIKGADA